MEIALAWLPRLLVAAALTIGLSAVVFTLSAVFGLLLSLVHYGREKSYARKAIEAFSAFFRSVPELVVLFLFFFGGPQVGIDFGPIGSTIIAFALVGIAFDYQVFKGALKAIPFGQYEAGLALGLPKRIVFLRVLIPQVLPLARKGWITYAIGTVKRMSIASAVSVSEILYVTKQGIAATNAPFTFLTLAVGLYILIVTPLLVFNERKPKQLVAR
ncbi:ABC transporter permease subunit [Aminobacter sp. AP02]|uniref:ABC transporter permease subunit n=1 Tax=Aminobacter sp. AP02 TaxID=2135737 RepID=UPI000D6A8D33|nr:ABC transporter permease subunit [Aminobacter sp. AP02]PWK64082.1 polar amino acid transport system permease protein [Aminobacter sp. AP02]